MMRRLIYDAASSLPGITCLLPDDMGWMVHPVCYPCLSLEVLHIVGNKLLMEKRLLVVNGQVEVL